jgi:hypothetical protein
MWLENRKRFARLHQLSLRDARERRCTAEHVTARCDNGQDTESNIVAACLRCNRGRHAGRAHAAPDAEAYKAEVKRSAATW